MGAAVVGNLNDLLCAGALVGMFILLLAVAFQVLVVPVELLVLAALRWRLAGSYQRSLDGCRCEGGEKGASLLTPPLRSSLQQPEEPKLSLLGQRRVLVLLGQLHLLEVQVRWGGVGQGGAGQRDVGKMEDGYLL